MSEFILRTEPFEFKSNQQNAKINFLQKEIQQLHDQIKDMEDVLKLNKEALKIALNLTTSSESGVQKALQNRQEKPLAVDAGAQKPLQQIIEKLYDENNKLHITIEKLTGERNIAQSKALINEQIAEEAQRHENEVVAEFEEKIADLLKMIEDKESTIQELEKIKPVSEKDGVVIQYREVMSPSEQNMKLHIDLEIVKASLIKSNTELEKLKLEKQELLGINFSLANEINKLRATLASPLNSLKPTSDSQHDLNSSTMALVNFHKKFLDSGSDSDELSPMNSPLPDKVQPGAGKTQAANTKVAIPKLDLTKAKKIQELNAKRSTQQLQQNQNPTGADPKLMEKIKSLETDLEKSKKLLQLEMCNNKILREEIDNLKRFNSDLMSTNDVLIKSNFRYEEKWRKIFHALEFYKEFYHKYIDLMNNQAVKSTGIVIPSPKLADFERTNERFVNEIFSNPEKIIKERQRKDEETGRVINISILEAADLMERKNEFNSFNRSLVQSKVTQLNRDQAKIYLMNLAKDLYLKTNMPRTEFITKALKDDENFELNNFSLPPTKLKRSVSNPLDYVNLKKTLIYEKDAVTSVGKKKPKQVQTRNQIVKGDSKEPEVLPEQKPQLASGISNLKKKFTNVKGQGTNQQAVLKESPQMFKDLEGTQEDDGQFEPENINYANVDKDPKGRFLINGKNLTNNVNTENEDGMSFTVDIEEIKKKQIGMSFMSNDELFE